MAGSVAPGVTIVVYFVSDSQEQDFLDGIDAVIADTTNNPSVLSISYGAAESGWTSAGLTKLTKKFTALAAAGVTVFASSGDDGSDDGVGDGAAHAEYPASDPWVTACGGTAVTYVSSTSPYTFTEGTWNDPLAGDPQAGGHRVLATGGGVSDECALPSWQQGAGVPPSANPGHTTGRGIPDVAGNACPYSGYILFVGGAQTTKSQGGTSAVAPLYAGLTALINAGLGVHVGYLNPTLYALGGTNVFRDVNDGVGNQWAAEQNPAPFYTSGPGWDACTGWGSIDGSALLAALQQANEPDCYLIVDRSTYGQNEIAAMNPSNQNPAVIKSAFYVVVEGFTPADLNINTTNLNTPTNPNNPVIYPQNPIPIQIQGMTATLSALKGEDPSLPNWPQRFTFVYDVQFTNTNAFTQPVVPVTIMASITSTTNVMVSSSAVIYLLEQPDPYMVAGPIWWLSNDLRVFQITPGLSLRGSAVAFPQPGLNAPQTDAANFIAALLTEFNGAWPAAAIHPFDQISTDEQGAQLELSQTVSGTPVYNFAVARVRYRALAMDATPVRVFFRLFSTATTSTDYDTSTAYRIGGQAGVNIPLLGLQNNQVVAIPCFAASRVDTTQVNLNQQTDPANVQTITHDATGAEIHNYFGCWLDINQPSPVLFPVQVQPSSPDGPYPVAGDQSIQAFTALQFVRGLHLCLVAEINFAQTPIQTGVGISPSSSDKLGQRNLSIVGSDNPGSAASHRAPQTFEIMPTHAPLGRSNMPDELMIDWGNIPVGGVATLYLPDVNTRDILAMAAKMYVTHRLKRVNDTTLQCRTGGVTYVPIPTGVGVNFTGLLTVELPATVRRGQLFTIVVRQVTNALGQRLRKKWRRVSGAFQLTIPVRSKAPLRVTEERGLAVLRWIFDALPPETRWFPVFSRYVRQIADRVRGLGGNPALIAPSPSGFWVSPESDSAERPARRSATVAFTVA